MLVKKKRKSIVRVSVMEKLSFPYGYIIIVVRYLKWRRERYGNASMCFTYEGIFSWVQRQQEYRDIARTTIERQIRELARLGYLKRVRERPRALFCVDTEKVRELLRSVSKMYDVDWEVWE